MKKRSCLCARGNLPGAAGPSNYSEKRHLAGSAFVEKSIQAFPLYPFDLDAARIYVKLWANLVKKGAGVCAHDLMIASTTIAVGFSVITADLGDYGKIKELSVEKLTR
jgi:predicted nucleic acid-binding protein